MLVSIDAVNVIAAYQPVVSAQQAAILSTGLLPDDGSCVNRNMSEQGL